eukprot:TRINITY_DN38331_c0_g1_i1.p1 TRINITY_DN38331_c0_g1~~TRINITY_DN38331_c0_g1_i1.p1  ORF type:complete len:216 (-),score=58.53 TRINITY_DN38331_c0_g1_i1:824-1471(-)
MADIEQVDFEPEDDDLLAEDMPMEEDTAPPAAAATTRLRSTITGGAAAAAPPVVATGPSAAVAAAQAAATAAVAARKEKGRGFRQAMDVDDRDERYGKQFESLEPGGGPGPQKSVEGWIVLVTGVHEEAQEDDLHELFAEYGEIKNLHLNLDRRTGFVKGYALIEYETKAEAEMAISSPVKELLTQPITVSWAFSTGPRGGPGARKQQQSRRRNF